MKRPRKRRQERKKILYFKKRRKGKEKSFSCRNANDMHKKRRIGRERRRRGFARNKKMPKSLTRGKEKEGSRVNREMERRDGGGYDRNEKYKRVERRYQTVKKEVKERIREKIEMLRKEYEKREERWREERERI